jgi:hypothetical protein
VWELGGASLKLPFQEMDAILEAMKVRNLEPALSWAASLPKTMTAIAKWVLCWSSSFISFSLLNTVQRK